MYDFIIYYFRFWQFFQVLSLKLVFQKFIEKLENKFFKDQTILQSETETGT